jgi:hypothetical protein
MTDIGELTGTVSIDDQVSTTLDTISTHVEEFAKSFVSELGVLGVTAGLVTAAVGGMTAAIIAMGNTGSHVQDVETGFDRLAGSVEKADDILKAMREGVAGTVNDLELMTLANKALASGAVTTVEGFTALTSASRVLSKEGFGPVDTILNQIDRSLLTGQPRLLQRMGITVDLKAAEKAYAESLGTTADQLTKEGKLTADRTAILEALNKKVQQAGDQQLTFADRIKQGVVALENWGDELYKSVATSPHVLAALDTIAASIKATFGGEGKNATEVFMDLINKFADEVKADAPDIIANMKKVYDVFMNGINFITDHITAIKNVGEAIIVITGLALAYKVVLEGIAAVRIGTTFLTGAGGAGISALGVGLLSVATGIVIAKTQMDNYIKSQEMNIQLTKDQATVQELMAQKTALTTKQLNDLKAAVDRLDTARGVKALHPGGFDLSGVETPKIQIGEPVKPEEKPQVKEDDAFQKLVDDNKKKLKELEGEITAATAKGMDIDQVMRLFGADASNAAEKGVLFGNNVTAGVEKIADAMEKAKLDELANAAAIAVDQNLSKSFNTAAQEATKALSTIGFNYKGLQKTAETAQEQIINQTETGTQKQVDLWQLSLDRQVRALGATPDEYRQYYDEITSDYMGSLDAQMDALDKQQADAITKEKKTQEYEKGNTEQKKQLLDQITAKYDAQREDVQQNTLKEIMAIGEVPDAYEAAYNLADDVVHESMDNQLDVIQEHFKTVASLVAASGMKTKQELEKDARDAKEIWQGMATALTDAGEAAFTGPEIESARQTYLKKDADARGKIIDGWQQVFGAISSLGSQIGGSLGQAISGIGGSLEAYDKLGKTVTSLKNSTDGAAKALGAVQAISAGFSTASAVSGALGGGTLAQGAGGALGGLEAGAAIGTIFPGIGTAIGAGVGAAVGGAVGLIKGIVGSAGRDAVKDFANQQGGFDNLHSQLTMLGADGDKLWKELSNVGSNNKDQATHAIQDVTDALNKQNKAMSDLANTTGVWTKAQNDMVQAQLAAGDASGQAAKLLAAQNTNATTGLNTAFGVSSSAFTAQDADKAVLSSSSSTAAQIDAAQKDLTTQQGILDAVQVRSQRQASALAGAILGVVDANLKAGQSFTQAFAGAAPAIQGLQQQLDKTGFSGGAAFDFLNHEVKLATGSISGPALTAVEGITAAMTGLANQSALTQDMFSGLEEQVGTTFQTLVDGGATSQEAMAALQPDIQAAWEAEQEFGYKADDVTQALIDQGVQSGIVGEKQKSSTQQMIDALNHVATTLDHIAHFMTGDLVSAAQTSADGIQRAYDGVTGPDIPAPSAPGGTTDGGGGRPAPGAGLDGSTGGGTPPTMDLPLQPVTGPGYAYVKPGDWAGMPDLGVAGGTGGNTYNITVAPQLLDTSGLDRVVPKMLKEAIAQIETNEGASRTNMRAALRV